MNENFDSGSKSHENKSYFGQKSKSYFKPASEDKMQLSPSKAKPSTFNLNKNSNTRLKSRVFSAATSPLDDYAPLMRNLKHLTIESQELSSTLIQ